MNLFEIAVVVFFVALVVWCIVDTLKGFVGVWQKLRELESATAEIRERLNK